MTTARDLVDAIQSGKSATIQATFDALMTEKIQNGIEAYRQAVIDTTFNPEFVSESEEISESFYVYNHDGKTNAVKKKFATNAAAKKHAEKLGGDHKVASSEYWHDKLNPSKNESELDEDVALDELSHATLGSYMNKAEKSIKDTGSRYEKHMSDASDHKEIAKLKSRISSGNSRAANNHIKLAAQETDKAKKLHADLNKRRVNVHKAAKKYMSQPYPNESEELDEVAYDSKALDDKKKPVIARGVKGMKSTPFEKKFKSMSHYEKWADSEAAGNHEVHDVRLHESDEDESSMDSSIDEEFDLSEYTLEEIQEFMESEEFDSLDELSQNTLANYYQKAIGDRHSKDLARDDAKRKGDDKSAEKLGDKIYNRSNGLEKSKKKFLAKDESEEVSELSKKTLASYAKKASVAAVTGKEASTAQASEMGRHLDKGDVKGATHFAKKANDLNTKVIKRVTGIAKAADKLAKD